MKKPSHLKTSATIALALLSQFSFGACEPGGVSFRTQLGKLTEASCQENKYRFTEYKLGGKTVYKAADPSIYVSLEGGTTGGIKYLLIEVTDPDPRTRCTDHMALLDFTATKPRVFHFGVKRSCSIFVASLLRRGTLYIRLNGNVKVSYKNGKFKMPDADEAMEGHMVFPGYPFDLAEIVPYVTQLHYEGTE